MTEKVSVVGYKIWDYENENFVIPKVFTNFTEAVRHCRENSLERHTYPPDVAIKAIGQDGNLYITNGEGRPLDEYGRKLDRYAELPITGTRVTPLG